MYQNCINRTHRTSFVIMIDQSGSMQETVLFGCQRMTSGRRGPCRQYVHRRNHKPQPTRRRHIRLLRHSRHRLLWRRGAVAAGRGLELHPAVASCGTSGAQGQTHGGQHAARRRADNDGQRAQCVDRAAGGRRHAHVRSLFKGARHVGRMVPPNPAMPTVIRRR